MTPQELVDGVRALVARGQYEEADALLSGQGRAQWARMTAAQRQEIDELAHLVQLGRDTLVAATPTHRRSSSA